MYFGSDVVIGGLGTPVRNGDYWVQHDNDLDYFDVDECNLLRMFYVMSSVRSLLKKIESYVSVQHQGRNHDVSYRDIYLFTVIGLKFRIAGVLPLDEGVWAVSVIYRKPNSRDGTTCCLFLSADSLDFLGGYGDDGALCTTKWLAGMLVKDKQLLVDACECARYFVED